MTAYLNVLNHRWLKWGGLVIALMIVSGIWGTVLWEQLVWYRGWSVEGIPKKIIMPPMAKVELLPVEITRAHQPRFDAHYPHMIQLSGFTDTYSAEQWLAQQASPLYPCVDWVLSEQNRIYLGPIWTLKDGAALTEQLADTAPSVSQHVFFVPTARRQHGTTCHVDGL